MIGYLVSLLMGLAVGVAYGVVQVRSPAPPLIALIGLLGMVLGEQAIDLARATFRLSPKARLSSLPAMSAGRASQAASRTRHERSIGLFLPFARSAAAGRTRAAKITVKIHRGRIRACNRWRTSSGHLKPLEFPRAERSTV
jgi:XapX domain-containing protein